MTFVATPPALWKNKSYNSHVTFWGTKLGGAVLIKIQLLATANPCINNVSVIVHVLFHLIFHCSLMSPEGFKSHPKSAFESGFVVPEVRRAKDVRGVLLGYMGITVIRAQY